MEQMSPFDRIYNKRHDFQVPIAVKSEMKSEMQKNGEYVINPHKDIAK